MKLTPEEAQALVRSHLGPDWRITPIPKTKPSDLDEARLFISDLTETCQELQKEIERLKIALEIAHGDIARLLPLE